MHLLRTTYRLSTLIVRRIFFLQAIALTKRIVTFIKFSISTFDATWRAGHAAVMISFPQGIRADTNDLGGRYYRKVSSLRVPKVFVKVLLSASTESDRWLEAAEIIADAYLDIYASPRGHRDTTATQIAYVEEQDTLTSRARQMLVSMRLKGVKPRTPCAVHLTDSHSRS